jgi:hypothetical protein
VIALVLGFCPAQARSANHDRHWYQWAWQDWLPAKWQRIARCETGINWRWNSGTYQGAFGFYYGTWDNFRPSRYPSEAYLANPRQQYTVALRVYARYGYGAWGCGGA